MPAKNYVSYEEFNQYINTINETKIDSILTTSLHGIFGMPYQFMESVDRRMPDTSLGRKYAEKIVSRMPLLFLTPCKQVFMEGFGSSDKKTIIEQLVASNVGDDIQSLLQGTGRYYTTKFDYSTYYRYVNMMCWIVARYLGIENEVISNGNGKASLKSYDWSNATNDAFKTYFSASENVIFYLDGLNSISESFSNGTTESSLASTVNGLSDQAKELQFILGSGNTLLSNVIDGLGDLTTSITSGLSGSITNLGSGILGGILGKGTNTILSGGKIIFPELWQDSSFDRTYSIDIKLRSPDHDTLSIYLNIIVPFIHLLALTLPRGLDGSTDSGHEDPNGYTSPFLVRAYSKGMFNVDMGLITGMSVTKGGECCWNDDGLPTQMDISIDIKDLYSVLFMSTYSGNISLSAARSIVSNTAMMDYLANMSGINVGQQEIGRKATYFWYLSASNYQNLPSRIWTKFDQGISNIMDKLYQIL